MIMKGGGASGFLLFEILDKIYFLKLLSKNKLVCECLIVFMYKHCSVHKNQILVVGTPVAVYNDFDLCAVI